MRHRWDRWWMWAAVALMTTLLVTGCAPTDDKKGTTEPADDSATTAADDQDADDQATADDATDQPAADESTDKPATDVPAKDEGAKDEPADAADAPAIDPPMQEEPAKEEPAKEEPAKEEPAKEAPAKEAPAKEAPAKEEPAKEEPAKEEPAKEAPAAKTPTPGPAVTAPAAAEPPMKAEPAKEAAPADEPAPKLTPYEGKVPLGLPDLKIPADNPMSVEKIELGKMLYFDKRLSKDGTVACASCHGPKEAWAEHTPTSKGIGGQMGGANAPTVINAAYAKEQFWDGRAATLEVQALGPIENPIEMGHTLAALIPELNAIAGYKAQFQKVFQTDVTKEGIAKAIAAFERTVLSGNSPYDKFTAGDKAALNDIQKKGMELFDDVGCSTCHSQPMFSSYRYYNAGVGMDKEKPDQGRKAVTNEEKDLGKYRVPSLREAANTAPYFHDGSCDTLEKAVAMMAGGGIANDNLSGVLKGIGTKKVSAEDQAAIVEFLKALSGEYPVMDAPKLP